MSPKKVELAILLIILSMENAQTVESKLIDCVALGREVFRDVEPCYDRCMV